MNKILVSLSPAQQQAYQWAKEQNYQSIAAQYAKTLAEAVEVLAVRLEVSVEPKP